MAFNFKYPLALFALLPAVTLSIFIFLKHRSVQKRKGLAPLLLRLAIMLLLIISLAGMELKTLIDNSQIVFVADLSDSTLSKQNEIKEFIIKSLKLLPDKYQSGIIGFGDDALVEQIISGENTFFDFHSKPNSNYSNMDKALQRAEALFSQKGSKRIVLITDGAENLGNSMQRANVLGQRGIRIDGVFMDTLAFKEVQLTGLDLPDRLYQGENYSIRVEIDSTVDTTGILRLFSDRRPAGIQQIEIQKGHNVFIFQQTAKEKGTVVYEAEFEALDDTLQQNNRMASFVQIEGAPVIALVEGTEGEGRELAKILEAGGLEYKLFTPHTLPEKLDELIKYEAIILANTDYDVLGEKKTAVLDGYVKSMGRGLLVTGGDNSYALGGYLGTQLEKMLPVDMDLTNKEDIPSLALVLVIDKSGSMSDNQFGISKMELAKEAAIRSVDALKDTDFIGVVGFDFAASWYVNVQKAENREDIQNTIGTIQAGGGTNLYPGMSLAFESLKKADAALKHVIVLTDGQTAGGNFEGILSEMVNEGITVSGVAVGNDADTKLMEQLANLGNGRYYFTDDFASIPKIFTKETYMAAKSYINNETFYPKGNSNSPILANIEAVPALDGYITTTIKGGAEAVLVSDSDDPVLAHWDYGLGKVAAWTSDVKGMWTEEWLKWGDSSVFWLNTISSVLPGGTEQSGRIETDRVGNQGQVTVSMEDLFDQGLSTTATIVDPNGNEMKLELNPSKPGHYQGNFDLKETGVYLVRVDQQLGGGAVNSLEAGLMYPYSPEYDIRKVSSKSILEHIVLQASGRIIEKPEDLLMDEQAPVWEHRAVWPVLIHIALLLFILDVALRKLGIRFVSEKLSKVFKPANSLLAAFRLKVRAVYINAIKDKSSGNDKNPGRGIMSVKNTGTMTNEKTKVKQEKQDNQANPEKKNPRSKAPQEDNFTGELLKARKSNKISK